MLEQEIILYVTYSYIRTPDISIRVSTSNFADIQDVLLPLRYYSQHYYLMLHNNTIIHNFGVFFLAPIHCRRELTRSMSCYAFFIRMAASKPTSGLSLQLHYLPHLEELRNLNLWSGLLPSWLWSLSPTVCLQCLIRGWHSEFTCHQ